MYVRRARAEAASSWAASIAADMPPLSVVPMRCPGSAAAASSAAGEATATSGVAAGGRSGAAAASCGVIVSAAFIADTGGCTCGVVFGVPCNIQAHFSRLMQCGHDCFELRVQANAAEPQSTRAGRWHAHRSGARLQMQVGLRVEGAGRLADEALPGVSACHRVQRRRYSAAVQPCLCRHQRTV